MRLSEPLRNAFEIHCLGSFLPADSEFGPLPCRFGLRLPIYFTIEWKGVRMIKKLLVFALAALLLLAMGNAVQAKTFKVALDADPVSLDPHEQLSGGMLQLSHWVFDPLIRWKQDGSFEPRLAEKWEKRDDNTWRFYLRKGVKFHSGNDFTAEDVKWTLERLKKSGDFKGLFDLFTGAEVVDDHTVDIKTSKPYGLVLNMATYIFPMDAKFHTGTDANGNPKDAIDKTAPTFAKTNESGTGPFFVKEREQGVRVVFQRFKDYWDKDSPGNVTEFVLTPIKEDATRVAALLSGDVDFISPVPPQDHDRIRKNKDLNLVTISGGRIITFQLNQNRREEFKDPRVRQAIMYATNNVGIVEKIMKGFATPAAQQSPAGYMGHNPDLKPRFDLAKAKQLMKEAGYEKGFTVTAVAPNNRYVNDEKIAEAFAAMLSKINIKVDLKTMPKAQYWEQFDLQVADIQMIGWHSDTEDSANFSEYLVMCPDKETGKGQYNSGNYCNPKVDELVLASLTETDMAKRAQILKEVEKILYEDAAFVPFHWQNHSYAGKKGIDIEPVVNVMNFPYFGDIVVH